MMWMHYCTYGLQVYLPPLVCGPSCARPLTAQGFSGLSLSSDRSLGNGHTLESCSETDLTAKRDWFDVIGAQSWAGAWV